MGHDVAVIGAGVNGLTLACSLARRGLKVVVLESRAHAGGTAAAEEFHPGYRGAGLFHDTGGVLRQVVAELGLERHGLVFRERRTERLMVGNDGADLLLAGDATRAAGEIRRHSQRDVERYRDFCELVERLRPVLRGWTESPPLDVVRPEANRPVEMLRRGLALRRLGRRGMLEFLRLPPMCLADWLDEWFETDLLKAGLALPALAGTYLGPRSPTSNTNLLLSLAAGGPGLAGGGPMLATALEAATRSLGVEIRTSSPVQGILLDAEGVEGLELADGTRMKTAAVVSSICPKKTMLDLLPRGCLAHRTQHHLRTFRTRGTSAQVLLALDARPRFRDRPEQAIELAATAGCLDDLERAFDAVKYRRVSEHPVLDVSIPSISSPGLAPPGHAVVSVWVHFAPHDLDPPWDPDRRDGLGDQVVEALERCAPGLAGTVVGRRVLAPPDLEERYGLSGGQVHRGEHALDQLLVRPSPECSRYATPIRGLTLCGAGSHPGGGLTCAPGAFAARAVRPSGTN